jgi:hypothetical protein
VAVCIAGAAILIFTQFPNAATLQTRDDHAASLERIYDVDLMIARVACGNRSTREKSACVNDAKAVNVKLGADATEKYAK